VYRGGSTKQWECGSEVCGHVEIKDADGPNSRYLWSTYAHGGDLSKPVTKDPFSLRGNGYELIGVMIKPSADTGGSTAKDAY
jgi:hypothetical protein